MRIAQEVATGHEDCLGESAIFDYVSGNLDAAATAAIDAHLRNCAECRELVACVGSGATAPASDEGRVIGSLLALFQPLGDDATGSILDGKYRLLRRLGQGGMGVVYEAVNTRTGRHVAVKLLHAWFSRDRETAARFQLEARSATRIAHPNIVEVLDLGQNPSDGALYMVQELLSGETLRQRISTRGSLSVAEAVALLTPIMEALAAAHEAGVVHRDVKPENIILASDRDGGEVPKLIDFGISKSTSDDIVAWLQTGRAMGTPAYMSPEQLKAADEVDGRADIWAVGVVLFELLTGERPFAAATNAELTVQILSAEARSLAQRLEVLPAGIAAVIARALERDPGARFATVRAMLTALGVAVTAPSGVMPGRRRARATRVLERVAPLFVLLGVAALVTPVLHRRRPPPPSREVVLPVPAAWPRRAPPIAPALLPVAAAPSLPPPSPPRKPARRHAVAKPIAPPPAASLSAAPTPWAPMLDP
jgi:serine/threonine-protein kinase